MLQLVSHIVESYHPAHSHHAAQGLQRVPPRRLGEQYSRTPLPSFFHVPRCGEHDEYAFSDALLYAKLEEGEKNSARSLSKGTFV